MSTRIPGPARRLPSWAAWLILALALPLATACAPLYADPGAQPALVKVHLECTPSPAALPVGAKELRPQVHWDWGLYLLDAQGGLTPLRPQSGHELKGLAAQTLAVEETFLVPPGQRRLRLLAEGYVLARYGMALEPRDVALVQQDLEMDLAPGQERVISQVCPSVR